MHFSDTHVLTVTIRRLFAFHLCNYLSLGLKGAVNFYAVPVAIRYRNFHVNSINIELERICRRCLPKVSSGTPEDATVEP